MESAFSTTALSTQLIGDIQKYIAQQALEPGARLPERSLAEHFRVSRSPIRAALHHMAERSLITRAPEGGYVVGEWAPSPALPPEPEHTDEDEAYVQIARDRLGGLVPDRISEKEL
ncbi:MAG: GntR family transcriptional regulator, partial [Alcaligenaceae bacterium]